MKVIKHFEEDSVSRNAMNVFDRVVGYAYFNWPLEKLEVYVASEPMSDSWLEGNSAKIFIDKDHHFIQEKDEKGIESLILTNLHSLMLRLSGFETSDLRQTLHGDQELFQALLLLEDFVASRKVAHKFPDVVFYRSMDRINRTDASVFLGKLEMWLSCLVFYRIDQWNMDYLDKLCEAKTGSAMDESFMKSFAIFLDTPHKALTQDDVKKMVEILKSHISRNSNPL